MADAIRNWRPGAKTRYLLAVILQILKKYAGVRMTLRQLYYQLVTVNVIANKESEYKRVAAIVSDARYAGLIPWECIEDRTRVPMLPSEFDNVAQLVEVAVQSYELDYWRGQKVRPEIWVEKQALANIVESAVAGYHVAVVVNRGYGSTSSIYENAKRIARHIDNEQAVRVFYMGDHDPSGLNMVQDVENRLVEFLEYLSPSYDDDLFRIKHLALTMEQIEKFKPPPNPAKMSDSRAERYAWKYGKSCWELDSLPLEELIKLIETAIASCMDDPDGFKAIKVREQQEIESLRVYAGVLRKAESKKVKK